MPSDSLSNYIDLCVIFHAFRAHSGHMCCLPTLPGSNFSNTVLNSESTEIHVNSRHRDNTKYYLIYFISYYELRLSNSQFPYTKTFVDSIYFSRGKTRNRSSIANGFPHPSFTLFAYDNSKICKLISFVLKIADFTLKPLTTACLLLLAKVAFRKFQTFLWEKC